jgi:hypothetical protein
MPEPIIVPTTIAALIHRPSIRVRGSGEAIVEISVMSGGFASPGRLGNCGRAT